MDISQPFSNKFSVDRGSNQSRKTLVLMSDNRHPSKDISKFYNLTAYNNYMYSKSHGYDFKYLIPTLGEERNAEYLVCRNPSTKTLRHAAWSKILSIYRELLKYDTVVYLDSDAYFNNTTDIYEKLSQFSAKAPIKFLKDTPWFDKANTGFIVADNHAESFRFLKRWYWADGIDAKYDTEGVVDQYFVQNTDDPAYTVLEANQIKLNFCNHDQKYNRPIINHVTGKVVTNQYEVIYKDVEKLYGFNWFNEVMTYLESVSEEYSTDDVVAQMGDAQRQLHRLQ